MVNSRTIKKLAKANRRIRSWFAGEKKGEGHHYAVISVSGWQRGLHQAIKGKDETRRFLESLGFVVGGSVRVISELNGDLIVNIKESRVAISRGMANRIMV